MEHVVTSARAHPVLAKILSDDPHTLQIRLTSELPALLAWVVERVTPPLQQAIDGGILAEVDPSATAEWLVRMAFSLVFVPALDDLRTLLTSLIVPALSPHASPEPLRHRG